MTKTKNYALNQWVGSDRILRTDFNEDNSKLEAALTSHENRLDAHDTEISNHGTKLAAHDTKLAAHDETIESHTTTLASHTSTIKSHTSSISSLTSKTNSNATKITNLTETVSEHYEARLRMISGSYTGNGAANRTINIGTEVSLIFIWRDGTLGELKSTFGILPASGVTYHTDYAGDCFTHTGKGFLIENENFFNVNNVKFYYTAFTNGN